MSQADLCSFHFTNLQPPPPHCCLLWNNQLTKLSLTIMNASDLISLTVHAIHHIFFQLHGALQVEPHFYTQFTPSIQHSTILLAIPYFITSSNLVNKGYLRKTFTCQYLMLALPLSALYAISQHASLHPLDSYSTISTAFVHGWVHKQYKQAYIMQRYLSTRLHH